jgi:integrase
MKNANGYGSIVKLPGKRRKPFAVKVTTGYTVVDGKSVQHQKYLAYFAKRSEAVSFLSRYNDDGILPEQKKTAPTLSEVYREWYNFKWNRKNRPEIKTFDRYDSNFKKLLEYHDCRIDMISLGQLQEVLDANRHHTKSVQTQLTGLIHNVWKFALDHEYMDKDVSKNLVLEYSTDKVRKREIFSDDEIRKLIEMDTADALLMIFTGIRCGEMCGLRIDNIYDDYIVTGSKTEAGRDRHIPIAPQIRTYIRPDGGTFYRENRSGSVRSTSDYTARHWHPMMRELGMDHTPHDCRHTCATLMERAKIPGLHRKLILGHKVSDITEGIYTHVSHEDLMEDMKKICSLFW